MPPLVREGVTEKISAHVHVIPDNSVPMVPNVGIVVGSRATLVIDTGLGARNGAAVMREVAKVSRNTELYLVTTHVHPEHDLGAGGFPATTKMIRSKDQVDEIAASGLEMAKRFAGFSPLHAELLQGAEFRKADITFEKEHTLDLGGVTVRFLAMGFNHTRGDTATFVEPDKVLFSGDVAMKLLPSVGAGASLIAVDRQPGSLRGAGPGARRAEPWPDGRRLDHGATRSAFVSTVQQRAAELKQAGKTIDETVDDAAGRARADVRRVAADGRADPRRLQPGADRVDGDGEAGAARRSSCARTAPPRACWPPPISSGWPGRRA